MKQDRISYEDQTMIDGVGSCSGHPPLATGAVEPGKTDPAKAASRVGTPVAAQAPATSSLSRIARDLSASPPVDTARVLALRTAIAAGTYRADPDAIATKMLALESPAKA